jgi:CHAT domain-containing protein/tetratricopeptide (TPR) repeat protein
LTSRLPALLCGLALAACARERPSLEEVLAKSYEQLQDGDVQAAQARADEGRRRARELRDPKWEWRFKVVSAEILVEQLLDKEALELLAGLPAAGTPPDPSDVRALVTRGFARCALASGATDFTLGKADLEEASRLSSRLGSRELSGWAILRRGYCALYAGEPDAADLDFREAVTTAREAAVPFLESRAALSLGLLKVQTRRYDEAAGWLDKALELGSALGANRVVVRALTNLGWCYYTLGDYERALGYLTRAASLADARAYAAELMLSLQNIGNTSYRLRDLAAAGEHYRRALAVARQLQNEKLAGELLLNLGIVGLEQGRYDEAEGHVREATQIMERNQDFENRQDSRKAEGDIWEGRGVLDKAETLYREVLSSPHSKAELRWEVRAALGALRIKQKRPAEADVEFRRAFALMEESRGELTRSDHKISFASSLDRIHDDYVGFLVEQGRVLEALEVADRSRARLLREMLESERALPRVASTRFEETARALDSVILFYWLAPSRSFLWEVTPGAVKLHVLPAEAEIREHVEAHQGLILQGRDPLAEGSTNALWLYVTLVGPVEGRLRPGASVVFVPDGPLHQLNPETLVASSPRPHYWLEDVTLATAPSLSVLVSRAAPARAPGRRGRSILMIGDPLPSGSEFPRLANARRELERIGAQFEVDGRSVYAEQKAEPAAYRAAEPGRYAFIHFAAHAQANREVPLESAVILTPRNESSKLYAREIVGVPLRAELVTLSACRGAGAREFAGEGLVGLTWAFLSSGAGNVIAGLWNVEDASTAELMASLYRGVASGKGPAEALRQAKLELRRSDPAYAKPYYWAPFVTYTRGAPRRP